MNDLVVIALCLMIFTPIIGFLFWAIIGGVGFKHLMVIFKTKRKVKKGFGLCKIFYPTGYPQYFQVKLDGKNLNPLGDGKGEYIFKKNCIYPNEYGIPTIDYNIDDADPRDPNTGLISVTSPITLENLITKAVRTDSGLTGFMEWLKKNWYVFFILIIIFIGGFLFTLIHFYDGNIELARQLATQTVVNLPTE